ncbi:helicase-exonuclease AddAB subunit AddB [Anaerotignum faecicola]|nr:helicase-exonuclease AddAB subunit AddB [Anaerotignum faecicola]
MALNFVAGRSGSGKTEYCLKSIAKKHKENYNGLSILIVPDQFSFQAEKDLIAAMGNKVIMRAKVLSFTRLAHTVFSKTGCGKTIPLTDVSKAVALRKIMIDNAEKLLYYKKSADKKGFSEQLSSIITEFFRYTVPPQKLLDACEGGGEALGLKIKDLALIYGEYINFINEGYLSSEETLDILYGAIDGYRALEGAEIWIDGFDGFTPQEYKIIGKLLKISGNVTVVLTMDRQAAASDRLVPSDLFFGPKETYLKLCRIASDAGVEIKAPVFMDTAVRYKSAGIANFEKNYGRTFFKSGMGHEGIAVYYSANIYDEIEAAAVKILHLVRDENYRFRDIALMAGSAESYEGVIKKVLAENGIPYFIDVKRDISAHPLVLLVKGIMEVFIYNFSFESVFGLLKTGLTQINRCDIETLENYCLAHGIKGYKWDMESWSFGLEGEEHIDEYIKINSVKNTFMSYFVPLRVFKNMKKPYSAKSITSAVFKTIENMGITDRLDFFAEYQTGIGIYTGAAENRRIWDIIMEIFDSVSNMLGDTEITFREYYSLLDSGISVSRLGLIPPTIDNITVGTLERTRLPDVKALFVVGANDGVIPSAGAPEGILKDDERNLLEKNGVTLAPDGVRTAFEEQFLIYKALTKPSEKLFISFPTGSLDGKTLAMSPVVSGMLKMFPGMAMECYDPEKTDIFISPPAVFRRIGTKLKCGRWQEAFSYFEKNAEWEKRAALIKKGLSEKGPEPSLSHESCTALFGGDIYSSVSRLERFAACPYAYFMAYTVKAKERHVFRLNTPDLGLLFHGVLEDFSYLMQEKGETWKTISFDDITELTNTAVDRQAPNIGNEILFSNNGLRYLIKRLKRISVRAVSTIAEHIKSGDFEPYGYEVSFGDGKKLPPVIIDLEDGKKLILTGKIDRVDILSSDGTTYVKVIDYKSGKKSFSLQELYYGIQLQLLIYMDEFLKNGKEIFGGEIIPGGAFYFKIDDPMLSADSKLTAEQIEEQILKKLSMSGLVLDDDKVIAAMDRNIDGTSSIIPVGYRKTDGNYTAASMVASRRTFEKLCGYTIKTAAQIGAGIKKGIIMPSPYKNKQTTPCVYCIYKSVCGFDENEKWFKRRKLKELSKDDVFKLVEEGAETE